MSEKVSENKIDIKKLLKNKDAILKLGLILVIAGFILGYCASFVAEANQGAGVAVMQSAQGILLVGVIFFVYYFLVFFNIKKSSESLCSHCGKAMREDVKFCPHCGTESKDDVEDSSEKKD